VNRWAGLAQEARDRLVAGQGRSIGPLLNEGFDLRAKVLRISPGNMKLVHTGRELGAFTQFAGSGGAVVGCYDGDPERLTRLRQAYEAFGARLVVPDTGPYVPA
jgi:glucuronokinase